MKQYDIILSAMINNKNKKIWTAKDFQYEPYYVGYEASPRMSELKNMYEGLFIVGKDGKYRTLSINWDYDKIQDFIDQYSTDE